MFILCQSMSYAFSGLCLRTSTGPHPICFILRKGPQPHRGLIAEPLASPSPSYARVWSASGRLGPGSVPEAGANALVRGLIVLPGGSSKGSFFLVAV